MDSDILQKAYLHKMTLDCSLMEMIKEIQSIGFDSL